MAVETINQRLKAVLWPATTAYNSDGEVVLGTAEEILVRWETSKDQMSSETEDKVSKEATLYVSEDIEVGSQIWIGALADLPDPLVDLYKVKSFSKVPDLKGNKFRRTITITRKR